MLQGNQIIITQYEHHIRLRALPSWCRDEIAKWRGHAIDDTFEASRSYIVQRSKHPCMQVSADEDRNWRLVACNSLDSIECLHVLKVPSNSQDLCMQVKV